MLDRDTLGRLNMRQLYPNMGGRFSFQLVSYLESGEGL